MFNLKKTITLLQWTALAAISIFNLIACHTGAPAPAVYYPYANVYGGVCATMEVTPGCTFLESTGQRVTVVRDSSYNTYGHGSSDMSFVKFDYLGNAAVYDKYGYYRGSMRARDFAGWQGGSFIGVGSSGAFWENVSGGTYWYGATGVLYSANSYAGNYGEAINTHTSEVTEDDFGTLNTVENQKLVERAAKSLENRYGMKLEKATALASALNTWGVMAAEQGYTTAKDIDRTMEAFGVSYSDAVQAAMDLSQNKTERMKAVTAQTANHLGIQPGQAEKLIKDSYGPALSSMGYDVNQIKW